MTECETKLLLVTVSILKTIYDKNPCHKIYGQKSVSVNSR